METACEPGRVNISAFTYHLAREEIEATYRGKIDIKGKGEVDMYFVDGMKEKVTEGG
jgi:adenylate cyclase